MLFCIPNQKFNLVAQAVISNDRVGMLARVGRGKNDVLPIRTDQKHDSEVPAEVRTIGYRCENTHIGLVRQRTDLIKLAGEFLLVAPVNFAVVLLRSPWSIFWRTCVVAVALRRFASERSRVIRSPPRPVTVLKTFCFA